MTATPWLEPQTQAYCEMLVNYYRQHNHTFTGICGVVRCPCGQWAIIAQQVEETARVHICEGCGDWHSILFQ